MKSKELKTLRKKLTELNKRSLSNDWLSQTLPSSDKIITWEKKAKQIMNIDSTIVVETIRTYTHYASSLNMTPTIFQQCLDLFRENMSTLYQHSSWGLDMKEKEEEFKHGQARFLLVFDDTTTGTMILAAFVHFRFEYDNEDHPTCGVLYVYELQVAKQYQHRGMGKHLMGMVQDIGRQQYPTVLSKIVLTVFKTNVNAMKFYKHTLGFVVDETDPSQFGSLQEEYEILSLPLGNG
jgi:N-alpha-acetyltransferase 40